LTTFPRRFSPLAAVCVLLAGLLSACSKPVVHHYTEAGIHKIKQVIIIMQENVSWRYYVQTGTQPDCDNDSAETCAPVRQSASTPGIWNPLPLFGDVQQDHQLHDIQSLPDYFTAAQTGTLPAVSWIVPSQPDGQHPSA
jgi:phospholipase C